MNIRFSNRMSNIKASEIRELLKLTERPEVISFAGGLPASELFPIEDIKKVNDEVFDECGQVALQYSTTEGYGPLREVIADQRMKPTGVNVNKNNILVTNGSQQALEFTGKIFIDKGDSIICESPSYLGAINAFDVYEPNYIEIPMDEEGMIISELEKALKEHPEAKFIYTIPDFQNPSGITMSVERRKKIAEMAKTYQIPVIEDGPYSELIFEGKRYPTIQSFDEDGYVIYLGTYSKTFCPGLRIGWVCANEEVLQKYIFVKQSADLQTNTLVQMSTARFMEKHNLDDHVKKIIVTYKKRRDLMMDAIKEYFPSEIKYTYPNGGLFSWVELREDIDSKVVLEESLKQNVAFVPGGSFFPNGGKNNYFRLNFSSMSEEKIIEGIKRLGEVLKKYY